MAGMARTTRRDATDRDGGRAAVRLYGIIG
jgi:hypothetical protein